MKTALLSIVAIILLVFSISAWGADQPDATTSTGDEMLDRSLQRLNEAVKKDLGTFAKKLSRHYHMPEATTDWLLKEVGLTPADAYMAAKVSKLSNRSVEEVVVEYKKYRGKGWGVIAKNLGIKPGSKEFRELKKDDSGMLGESKGKASQKKEKKKKDKGSKKKKK